MAFHWNRFSRKAHYWGAIICALPVLLIILTGILLLLKKDIAWIQPPTQKAPGEVPQISFAKLFETTSKIPEAEIQSWEDINRIDVRPGRGILKVRADNGWEIQLDHQSGKVLHVAYRRTDLIESLHDGTFFHDKAKLWIFLPSALVLLALWITGIWLFLLPILTKRKRRKRSAS